MASPKPLSIEDKELRGNPGQRKLPSPAERVKVQQLFELPEAPVYMGKYAKKEWERTGPLLVKQKMLASSDLPAFEAYCMNVDLMIESSLDIQQNGLTIMGARGWVKNPATVTFGQASTAIRGFVGEFGLSPSARTRIRIPQNEEDLLGLLMDDDDGDE